MPPLSKIEIKNGVYRSSRRKARGLFICLSLFTLLRQPAQARPGRATGRILRRSKGASSVAEAAMEDRSSVAEAAMEDRMAGQDGVLGFARAPAFA